MKLSIVVPVYNEEGNLSLLHDRLSRAVAGQADDYEIIFINDGSRDRSPEILEELAQRDSHVKYLSLSRNFGHEIATTAGLDRANGDAVVLIDADLQDPPEVISQLLERWRLGAAVVYARRRHRAGESPFKRLTAFGFYRLLHYLSDVHIPPDTGDFRLMDRRVVEALRQCRENPRFVRGLVSWVGFRQEEVLYDRDERHAGQTKYNAMKLMRLAWEAICGFSLIPLQLAIWLGGLVTVLSVVMTAIIVIQKLFLNMPFQGYAMLACAMFFLSGVLLIMMGILAQYVGHIFRHTQNRPLYLIDREKGWDNPHG